ncbi:MAG: Extended Signal Peptide of Type secretion system, partial [Pseudomonadota bacterium]
MNKIHRVLWSRCRHQFVVVAENARSDGGGSP